MDRSDRPPRSGPSPGTTLYPGGERPERPPAPSSHSTSSFAKSENYAPSAADSYSGALPLLSYPNTSGPSSHPNRVQFSTHPNPELGNGNGGQGGRLGPGGGEGGYSGADFRRKKSLVRPDRERVDENHRLFNYRNHAAAMEAEGRGVAGVSRTGHYALAGLGQDITPNAAFQDSTNLRRGKSILAREEGEGTETGLSMFKRGATLRKSTRKSSTAHAGGAAEKHRAAAAKKQPLGPWMIFCLTLTLCCPSPVLKCFGEYMTLV